IAHWSGFGFAAPILRLFSQWMINIPLLWCPTPNHGQIGFAYLASHHRLPQSARSFWLTGTHQQARRWTLQPAHRVHTLTTVHLPGVLQRKLGFMLIDGATVDQQARGLVNRQQPWVAINFHKGI